MAHHAIPYTDQTRNTLAALCDGEICVDCCLCAKCGRKVGTPHIEVCACPSEGKHWRCRDCLARYVAQRLAPYDTGSVATDPNAARKHHELHGDMDGEVCLLNRCALHYPKNAITDTGSEQGG